MDSHTVPSYDRDLAKVSSKIFEVADYVKELIIISGKSISDTKQNYVDMAYGIDQKINQLDSKIENEATSLLALRQPMAVDLREVIAALKIAVIMERMGDLAKQISSRASNINVMIKSKILQQILEMVKINVVRIDKVMNSYRSSDIELAKEVFTDDQLIDNIYKKLTVEIEEEIIVNPELSKQLIQLIFVAKNLERIGDYISRTAALVHYVITGERFMMLD